MQNFKHYCAIQIMLKEVQFITQEVTMSGVKALGPDEVLAARKASLPDVVIEVFNELISENFNGHSAIVYQSAVVKHLVSKDSAGTRSTAKAGSM